MYVSPNFKSKKALREAVAAGTVVTVYSPGYGSLTIYNLNYNLEGWDSSSPGPFPCPQNGRVYVEGPHYPEPHRWYGSVVVENGVVIRVV